MQDKILESYQVRKSNREKGAFIEYIKTRLSAAGYDAEQDIRVEEKGKGIFKSRNIVVGDPEKAEVIFTAHYDTCAVIPFPNFMAPASVPLYLLTQVALALFIFLIVLAGTLLFMLVTGNVFGSEGAYAAALVILYAFLFYVMFGYRSTHTANDNTSGVLTLTGILEALPREMRDKVCVVYFDNEEKGLFGSEFFKSSHKKTIKDKLLINFDCVGDGRYVTVLAKKRARTDEKYRLYLETLNAIAESHDVTLVQGNIKPMMFPSDQMYFDKGVGVCALNKSPLGMYTGRIHTPFDTKCREENIKFLVDGAVGFVEKLAVDIQL